MSTAIGSDVAAKNTIYTTDNSSTTIGQTTDREPREKSEALPIPTASNQYQEYFSTTPATEPKSTNIQIKLTKEITNRIEKVIEHCGKTIEIPIINRYIEEKLNKTHPWLMRIRNGITKNISSIDIKNFCKLFAVRDEWMLSGQGDENFKTSDEDYKKACSLARERLSKDHEKLQTKRLLNIQCLEDSRKDMETFDDKDAILSRLNQVTKEKFSHLTKNEKALKSGLSASWLPGLNRRQAENIDEGRKGNAWTSRSSIEKYCTGLGINIDWVLTGQGDMLSSSSTNPKKTKTHPSSGLSKSSQDIRNSPASSLQSTQANVSKDSKNAAFNASPAIKQKASDPEYPPPLLKKQNTGTASQTQQQSLDIDLIAPELIKTEPYVPPVISWQLLDADNQPVSRQKLRIEANTPIITDTTGMTDTVRSTHLQSLRRQLDTLMQAYEQGELETFYRTLDLTVNISPMAGAGLGVIATNKIPKGTLIGPYIGKVLAADAWESQYSNLQERDMAGAYVLQTADRQMYIDPRTNRGLLGFLNRPHHRAPWNLRHVTCGPLWVGFVTTREIHPGEELTFNYGSDYGSAGSRRNPHVVA